jgi:hypothetical protein
VRRAWNLRTDPLKPWTSLAEPVDDQVTHIFNAAARVLIGNGKRCFFWIDKWLHGRSIGDIAPDVYRLINPLTKSIRTVSEAVANNAWTKDIKKAINIQMFLQVLVIWEEVSTIQLDPDVDDIWFWSWESNGKYSSKSIYKAHFAASTL